MHRFLLRRSLQAGKVTVWMSWRGAQRIFLPHPALCLRMQGQTEEMGRGRAYQCERRLGIMRPQFATLHALIHVMRN